MLISLMYIQFVRKFKGRLKITPLTLTNVRDGVMANECVKFLYGLLELSKFCSFLVWGRHTMTHTHTHTCACVGMYGSLYVRKKRAPLDKASIYIHPRKFKLEPEHDGVPGSESPVFRAFFMFHVDFRGCLYTRKHQVIFPQVPAEKKLLPEEQDLLHHERMHCALQFSAVNLEDETCGKMKIQTP